MDGAPRGCSVTTETCSHRFHMQTHSMNLILQIKNSVMKLVLTTLFDPTQKTTDNNVFKSIKSCSVRHRRTYEGMKCVLLVRQIALWGIQAAKNAVQKTAQLPKP